MAAEPGASRVLATAVAAAYGGAAAIRRALYDHRVLPVHRLTIPVISVGGLALGGEGKTPVARAVAETLLDRGIRAGVVASGYGGAAGRSCELVQPRPWWEAGDEVRRLGDEPVLLASWLGSRALVARGDKLAAARMLAVAGAEVVVVDDGLQHRRLHRDLELLVGSPRPPWPVPLGAGRELASLVPADLRWHHARDGRPPAASPSVGVRSVNVPRRLLGPGGRDLGGPSLLRGARVYLLAGVARPAALADLVRGAGAQVVGRRFVRDHRRFGDDDLAGAGRSKADLVLCTEKDAARMAGSGRWWAAARGAPVAVLTCELRVVAGASHLARHLDRLLDCPGSLR